MEFKKERRIFLYTIATITFTVLLVFFCFQFETFLLTFRKIADALSPFFAGMLIAFVLNTIVNLFEKIIFKPINKVCKENGIWEKIRRPISIVLSFIVVISLITLLLLIVIPELFASGKLFIDTAYKNLPIYVKDLFAFLNQVVIDYNLDIDVVKIQEFFIANFNVTTILDNVSKATTDILNSVISATFSLANGIFAGIMSIIFSVYFLSGKEKLIKTFKQLLFAYIPRKHANRTSMFLTVSNKVFSSYVKGQLTECVILGTLCFIGMSIIGLDYALMISCIITVTALVPIVGAFAGAAAGAILLLIANPIDAIWFLIFFIVLQQFEGNVIFPRVVGSSIGLPGVWTLAAVSIMGGLFGILGILIGTPTAGVFYTLIKHNSRERLKTKEIDSNVLNGSEVAIIYSDILTPNKEPIKQEPKKPNFKIPKTFVGKKRK